MRRGGTSLAWHPLDLSCVVSPESPVGSRFQQRRQSLAVARLRSVHADECRAARWRRLVGCDLREKDTRINHENIKHKKTQHISHNIKSGLWYLLEGVHRGRVGSKGEGKLQHVHLDGAEQGAGSLHNQLIVGLICVCTGTRSTGRVSVSSLFHSTHLFIYLPFRISTLSLHVLRSGLKCARGPGEQGSCAVCSSISTCFCWLQTLAKKH